MVHALIPLSRDSYEGGSVGSFGKAFSLPFDCFGGSTVASRMEALFRFGHSRERCVPCFSQAETFPSFHELFFLVGVHLGEVDIHGVRISFLFLFPIVLLCGPFREFVSLGFPFPLVTQSFAHGPARVMFPGYSCPHGEGVRHPFHFDDSFCEWGRESFSESLTGYFPIGFPFEFGDESDMFGDIFVQMVPFHFEVFHFDERGFFERGGDKGLFEPFFELVPEEFVVFVVSA